MSITLDSVDPLDALDRIVSVLSSDYLAFRPRDDAPEDFDEQYSFVHDRVAGVAGLLKGNASGGTEAASHKIARFLLGHQAPPRRDTPFWILGPDIVATIQILWKDKLIGHGHLPRSEVDWNRIGWENQAQDLPRTVPLRPWPRERGGDPNKNWMIQFKSFQQDVLSAAGDSIGGFCFTEPFPYATLLECVRGCREYNFPGSKFFEFTPTAETAHRTLWLEEMIQKARVPKSWKLYRCNTERNIPNLAEGWAEEFVETIAPEHRGMRLRGEFGTFEGQIYTSWNPTVHAIDVPDPAELNDCFHFRAIDWGGSAAHAFVVLWCYQAVDGRYYVYDEFHDTTTRSWEDRFREIHARDGWDMVRVGKLYKLLPLPGRKPRWQYRNAPSFGPSYVPHDAPDMAREANRYQLPTTRGRAGPYTYHAGIECVQEQLAFTSETRASGISPRLFVDRERCPNLCRQMRGLIWDPNSRPAGFAQGMLKTPPMYQMKVDDDCADALRLGIFSQHRRGASGPRATRAEIRSRPQVRHRR